MKQSQESLPIWKRRLVSNGSSAPPAWTAYIHNQKLKSRSFVPQAKRSPVAKFTFRIMCGAGVLMQGACDDFFVCVSIARQKKTEWTSRLSDSVLRVQVFYPNRKRVPAVHVAAAVAAIDAPAPFTECGCPTGPSVGQVVARRRAAGAQISSARSEARTAGICAAVGLGLASVVDVDFSQAGVVAPPDSPDLGIPHIRPLVRFGV